jgi:Rad3-related DNA helicase
MDIPFRDKIRITECVRRMCRYFDECGYQATHTKFVDAKIRVANHAMVAMEALIGKGVLLGEYDALVIDEAHVFIQAMRGALSFEYDSYVPDRLQKAHGDVFNLAFNRELHSASRDLFSALSDMREGEINPNAPSLRVPLTLISDILGGMLEDLWPFVAQYFDKEEMTLSMEGTRPAPDDEDLSSIIRAVFAYKEIDKSRSAIERIRGRNPFVKKIEKLVADGIMTAEEGDAMLKEKKDSELDYVPHMVRDRDGSFLKLEPVDVGRVIRGFLKMIPSVIIMSATLRSGDTFDYMLSQFGLEQKDVRNTLALPPTFDYPRQAMLYVENRLPAYPKFTDGPPAKDAYYLGMANRVRELCEASQGGAFILTPSWEDLNKLRDVFSRNPIEGCNLIAQGRGDNANRLIDTFKQNPRNVLLATKSFWEGVDVPGMGLRLVIVTRMPFISESDAVYTRQKQALTSHYVSTGMSEKDAMYKAFNKLSVNQACIELAQALGRLVRTETDRGGLAILDSRLGFSGRASYKVTVYKTFPMKPIGDLATFGQYLKLLGVKALKETDASRPVP